jgi:hypothetical protein
LKRFIPVEKPVPDDAPANSDKVEKENQTPNSTSSKTEESSPVENGFTKNETRVGIEESISLDAFHAEGLKVDPCEYKLKSIVHHHGQSSSEGHYTADASRQVETSRTEKDSWRSFDDGVSRSTTLERITTDPNKESTVYMMLYTLAAATATSAADQASSLSSEQSSPQLETLFLELLQTTDKEFQQVDKEDEHNLELQAEATNQSLNKAPKQRDQLETLFLELLQTPEKEFQQVGKEEEPNLELQAEATGQPLDKAPKESDQLETLFALEKEEQELDKKEQDLEILLQRIRAERQKVLAKKQEVRKHLAEEAKEAKEKFRMIRTALSTMCVLKRENTIN